MIAKTESIVLTGLLLLTCLKIPVFREEGMLLQFAITSIALGLYLIIKIKSNAIIVGRNLFLLLLFYFFLGIISTGFRSIPSLAIKFLLRDLVILAVFLSMPKLIQGKYWFVALKSVYVVQAIAGISQFYLKDSPSSGLLFNSNIFAAFINLALIIILKYEKSMPIKIISILVGFIAVYLSGSSFYLLFFLIILLVFSLKEFVPAFGTKSFAPWLIGGAVIIIGLLGAILNNSAIFSRAIIWKKSTELMAQKVLLGIGPGHWPLAFPGAGQSDLSSSFGKVVLLRPHNEWVRILVEQGAISIILCLAFLSFIIAYLIKNYKNLKPYALLAMALIFFDFTLYFSRESFAIVLLSSIVVADDYSLFKSGRELMVSGKRAGTVVLGSALFFIPYLYNSYLLQGALKPKQDATTSISILERINQTLISIDPSSGESISAIKGRFLIPTDPDQALFEIESGLLITPESCQTNLLYANLNAQRNFKKSLQHYNKSLYNCPCFLEASIDKSVLLYNNGDPVNAYKVLKNTCRDNQLKTNNLAVYEEAIREKLREQSNPDSIRSYSNFLAQIKGQ